MTFLDLPAGASVYVDSNTFIYHFMPHPQFGAACAALLQRAQAREFWAHTSSHALSEVAHRTMTLEAMSTLGWAAKNIAPKLKRHATEVQSLTRFRLAIDKIPSLGVNVIPIDYSLVRAATTISQQLGLLSGDALVVAVMRAHGLSHLASHDADFDRVPGITRYSPA